MTVDTQFTALNHKLQLLLKQYSRVKKENQQLKEALEQCKEKERRYEEKVSELQQQVSVLKFSAAEMNDKDKKDFEKQINHYIKEIDKCIAFLGT